MCSFDLVVNVKELKSNYSEYSAGLDVGGYFWIEQQIIDASGFGYGLKPSFNNYQESTNG